MLKNRLHIKITGIIDASDLHSVIGTLLRTLRRKVLTTHAFLPLRAIPQQIVACQPVAARGSRITSSLWECLGF